MAGRQHAGCSLGSSLPEFKEGSAWSLLFRGPTAHRCCSLMPPMDHSFLSAQIGPLIRKACLLTSFPRDHQDPLIYHSPTSSFSDAWFANIPLTPFFSVGSIEGLGAYSSCLAAAEIERTVTMRRVPPSGCLILS